MTHTVAIVLNIDAARAEEFEAAFREHELPIWNDFVERGLFVRATLTPLSISTMERDGIKQYLVNVVMPSFEGHRAHDADARFKAWNELADEYQPEEPFVFGGDAIIEAG